MYIQVNDKHMTEKDATKLVNEGIGLKVTLDHKVTFSSLLLSVKWSLSKAVANQGLPVSPPFQIVLPLFQRGKKNTSLVFDHYCQVQGCHGGHELTSPFIIYSKGRQV